MTTRLIFRFFKSTNQFGIGPSQNCLNFWLWFHIFGVFHNRKWTLRDRSKKELKIHFTVLSLIPNTRTAFLHMFYPFLFIKNKRLSEGNAAYTVGCDSPLLIVMVVWRPFCLNANFLGRVWEPYADNNGAPKGHYYLQRAVTPFQITQQNSLQRAGAP